MQGGVIWGINDGSGVMFDAHPYAWMKAGNLLASLASLSPEYLALARSVCPRRLLLPPRCVTGQGHQLGDILFFFLLHLFTADTVF